jgi:hypothetical protein
VRIQWVLFVGLDVAAPGAGVVSERSRYSFDGVDRETLRGVALMELECRFWRERGSMLLRRRWPPRGMKCVSIA